MEMYKEKYIWRQMRDINGKLSSNKDDNYLLCRGGGVVYRYNKEILVLESPSRIRLKKLDPDTKEVIEDYTSLILNDGMFSPYMCDDTFTVYFPEKNLKKLSKLFKLRHKRKMTEEQRLQLTERLAKARAEKNSLDVAELEEELIDTLGGE
jgi:hydroxymethylpyrimidine pyrophosphatase-like HAD family hydrolase